MCLHWSAPTTSQIKIPPLQTHWPVLKSTWMKMLSLNCQLLDLKPYHSSKPGHIPVNMALLFVMYANSTSKIITYLYKKVTKIWLGIRCSIISFNSKHTWNKIRNIFSTIWIYFISKHLQNSEWLTTPLLNIYSYKT